MNFFKFIAFKGFLINRLSELSEEYEAFGLSNLPLNDKYRFITRVKYISIRLVISEISLIRFPVI